MVAAPGEIETETPAGETVKFTPVTSAPMMVALCVLGLKEKPWLLGATA
jgi:hypothetical protein